MRVIPSGSSACHIQLIYAAEFDAASYIVDYCICKSAFVSYLWWKLHPENVLNRGKELPTLVGYTHSSKDQPSAWLLDVKGFLCNGDKGKLSLVILAAMPVNEFVLCIVKRLSFLCACSRAEFECFQLQRNCHCHSLLVHWDCCFSLLLTIQHSMDAFGYLKKLSMGLKMVCRRCHCCVSRMALMLRACFIIDKTLKIYWGKTLKSILR